MAELKKDQSGFIPMLIALVSLIVIAIILVVLRVKHAHSIQIKY